MNTLLFLVGIVIASYVVYYIINYYFLPKPPMRIGPEEMPLSKLTQVISSEQLKANWTGTSGSSLIFYIYPLINDRTSVSGNEYVSAVQIGTKQALKLLIAPDAGRGYDMAPAILEVYLRGSQTPEKINIPYIPLQKWTAVGIVKYGRRFNIFINGKLSVSHTCTAMPDFEDRPLKVGDPRMNGKIALMSIAPYALQAPEMRSMVDGTVDTEGKPYLSSGITSFFSIFPLPVIQFSWCPDGNCITPKKAGPLEWWSSPYA